jgi:MFS family permease
MICAVWRKVRIAAKVGPEHDGHQQRNNKAVQSKSAKPAKVHGLPKAVIAAMAFISGFSIMTIEMLGARILSPYFGGSLSVWGSIITVFMLALSVGYLMGGRLSTRNPNAVTYAVFFMAAAIFSLPLILLADAIMEPIFLTILDPRYGSLAASVLLFFIPTAILGMISPYSVRLLVETHEHSGHMAGLLFFVSTIGSALGTLGTSFYFVLWFEVNQILWGAVLALLLAAATILITNQLLFVPTPKSDATYAKTSKTAS